MLRAQGKFLYVITGSHVDFASHVASYALGPDWMDLFDIVIFFARKPSFFLDRRPFMKLEGVEEVDPFTGWDTLETGHFYSQVRSSSMDHNLMMTLFTFQGNWHDLNEFFEYVTEWEPSANLYFGDNILQDILAPHKFTKNCDSVAVSEELLAEGMVGRPASHTHASDLVSSVWGSYFYHPEPRRGQGRVISRASSFVKRKPSMSEAGGQSSVHNEMMKVINIRRVSSFKESETPPSGSRSRAPSAMRTASPVIIIRRDSDSPDVEISRSPRTPSTPLDNNFLARGASSGRETPCDQDEPLPKGVGRINTLWGNCIKNYAKMCIPDLAILADYPIDYKFPVFAKDSASGEITQSGFFPADPISLHTPPPPSQR